MCLDFHALKKITTNNKFRIPVIYDLLNEPIGAQFSTKFNIHYGYHQIHMKEVDISKYAFRYHEGNYESLVIPFGLCNAPSNFQILINRIFQKF